MTTPPREPRRRRPSAPGLSASERRRLLLLAAAFVAVLAVFFAIGALRHKAAPPAGPEAPAREESTLILPPVDREVLAGVRDDTPEARAILEPEPFAYLARMAQALVPEHLWRLGEPTLPFDRLPGEAAALRGTPVRLRGEVLHATPMRRSPDAPEEYWARMRTDEGREFLFVSLRVPETLFGGENYALADGYFFKVYSTSLGGEEVTLPLVVGRALTPSYRKAAPTREVDPALLTDVRDATLLEKVELDFRGMWHLMNVARTLRVDRAALDAIFAGTPELDRDMVLRLKDEAPLLRGRPFRIPGRVVERGFWYERAGENPLREEFVTNGFLGNFSLGRAPVRLLAPGKVNLLRPGGKVRRWYRGWFLQWWAYEDRDGNTRLAPVFVVADIVEEPLPESPLLNFLLWTFLGGTALFGGMMVVLVRRERRRARESVAALQRLRERRRASRSG